MKSLKKKSSTFKGSPSFRAALSNHDRIKPNTWTVFEHTCGAWRRKESARETVAEVRKALRRSMERHHPKRPYVDSDMVREESVKTKV